MAHEVLYCAKYGGYGFSLTFIKALYKRHPEYFKIEEDVDDGKVLTEEEFYANELDYGAYVRDSKGVIRSVFKGWFSRTDPIIIGLAKELGLKESSGKHCELAIAEIPNGYDYHIDEYDGLETVYHEIPYSKIISDLSNYYHTGSKDWKCSLTQKILDGEI